MYHDGNHSYIAENGSGDLKIQASAGSIFIQKDNGEEMIKATVDGAVELYHNDVLRLTTTSTGVSIGGSLTVPGNVSIGGTLTYEDVTNIDSVGLITARAGINVTGGVITGSGSGLTNLNGSNIASGTVPTARLGSGTASSSTFLRGDSTFAVVDTALIADTSPQLGGNLDVNTKNINFGDSSSSNDDRLTFGASADLQLFHDGSNNYISGEVDGKNLYLRSRRDLYIQCGDNSSGHHNVIYADNNGSSRLYHPASDAIRLQTSTAGVDITGDIDATDHIKINTDSKRFMAGASNDARMYHDGNDSYFDSVTGNLYFYNHASAKNITFGTEGNNRWQIYNNGHFMPAANNTYDIGSTSIRLRNVYTNDLNLSNEGSSNDVDNTWGDYTIQEGESDLFLINNRSGKKYKFNLTEVS